MTFPFCTTATATPGTFHCFMASPARSSSPCSLEAGGVADADAADFFLEFWAKLDEARNATDKNTTRAGFRMVFLSVMPIMFRIRDAGRTVLRGPADILQRCRKWVQRRVILVDVYGRRIGAVKEVEEFKHALKIHAFVDAKSLRDAHIHVHETRRLECVAARFQVATVKVIVAVLIERHERALRVAEAALAAEETAELNLPGKIQEPMGLKSIAQGKV